MDFHLLSSNHEKRDLTMKKYILAAALASFVSGAAYADTLSVTSVTNVTEPALQIPPATSSVAFVGTKNIIFTVAGKTCTWVGSASGSVPQGCNYGITVNTSTNELSNPTSLNNPVCTQSSQMLSLCK
ncbi:MAG: hypothetical protein K2Q10_04840 [Rhodospirillales bacterium]|nr:hypothetical protein [Rhodospirillales bacterium]